MTFNTPKLDHRGIMLVLSSPSGAGKTSISRRLLTLNDDLRLSISVTTRPPRPAEREGQDYFFVSEAEFQQLAHSDALLENACVFDHHYGTPRAFVEDVLVQGQDILFDIDWQGTQALTQNCSSDLVTIFILPPDWEELERRLRARAQDPLAIVEKRMAKAVDEMSHWAEYNYVLVNDDLESVVADIQIILTAERLKRKRQLWLGDFVKSLKPRSSQNLS